MMYSKMQHIALVLLKIKVVAAAFQDLVYISTFNKTAMHIAFQNKIPNSIFREKQAVMHAVF